MEAAIAWLVQAILAALLIDKLDAWIRRVGLADDVEKLKSGIRGINMVVSAVKERGIRNESLDESLALLKDLLYDADDVVDELDYCRLQELVEGVTWDEPDAMHGAERVDEISRGDADTRTPNSSVGRLRSPVWEHFTITEKVNEKPIKAICIYCRNEFNCETKTNGTSSMKKHLEKEHSVTCTKRHGLHPPNHLSTGEPIVIGSSSRRKGNKQRSKAWDSFDVIEEENGQPIKSRCKYCPTVIKCGTKNGTASMLNHNKICNKKPGSDDQPPNPSSNRDATANVTPIVTGESSRKRRKSAQIIAANARTPWDKATLSSRIRKIASQLQDIQRGVSEVLKLYGSDLASNSNHHQSITLDEHLRTSSLIPRNVYGRVAEKNSIIKMIIEERFDGVVVLPIVGIAGVGKTTLAQLVYNDPDVEHQFDQRIWVWVSHNFDEMTLTKEILNSVSQERHEGINSFVKLQETLKSHANSKRLLLILDNVWDDMNAIQWDKMLAPLASSSHVNGNVILVTTRNMSVAQRLGTLKPVKLGALENDDFWLLFQSRAFGYENCEEHQTLSSIGRQIAEKLKGNPLAAVSIGDLLIKKFNTDYWGNVLNNEDWKSIQLSGGIMAALKLSYDQLPYHLQQCFSYCSIFPNSYQFLGEELVGFWISQGFVKRSNSSQRLEDIGRRYLIDLVNLGFFEEVKREEPYLGSQVLYAICGLMHDFVVMVSKTDCASIDGLQCNKMPQTIRHLSIITGSAYNKDQHGNIPRDEKFEEILRNAITSVSRLRTLVLLGHCDSFFLLLFQDIFQKAHNLRVLQMSDVMDEVLPQLLSKLYHLQVLEVSYTEPSIPGRMNNLVSLRHLVVRKGLVLFHCNH
ncbi:unnamed protein product [Triticum turgidum subsp. durum]|uniref:BED-type domain-containing protein n=1 Tax=Triticum turgidum subsp. durum TaxID=4567 RepID=A0A9R1PYS8_TRITD|nr:unnamed protein product [Triticum turgidum subsp. durum]